MTAIGLRLRLAEPPNAHDRVVAPVTVEHRVELRERRKPMIDRARGEALGLPFDDLLANVFRLDSVPAAEVYVIFRTNKAS